MSAETLLSYLRECRELNSVEFQTVSQCAPVLKGIKVCNIVTLPEGAAKQLREGLQGSKVLCVLLSSGEGKEVVCLYRFIVMQTYLRRPEIQRYLHRYGYQRFDVASVMIRLRKRYGSFGGGMESFPHEIGVILGYPIEDVESFTRHKGKNYLLSGYWKVYHNKTRAETLFGQYDEARQTAMQDLLAGYTLYEIAAMKP